MKMKSDPYPWKHPQRLSSSIKVRHGGLWAGFNICASSKDKAS